MDKKRHDFDTLVNRRHTHAYKWDCDEMADDVIPMWVADMDFRVAQPIVDTLHRRVEHGVFGYTSVPEAFYEATRRWFARRHGWTMERAWMMYTTGVVPALSAVVKALTMPGERVVVQTPVYNCFFSSIRNNGCEVIENPLRRVELPPSDGQAAPSFTYEMDYDDLERKCADEKVRLLVLCNPHNPAGRVWTRDELERLGAICRRHDVTVVSDEIHCELLMSGHRYVPFASVSDDCRHCSVSLLSPSKSFNLAGLQIAVIVSDDAERRRRIDRAININEVCDVNPFGVEALMTAYNQCEDWIVELNDYLWRNYCALVEFVAAHLPQLKVCRLEGTYLVWVDIRATGMGSDQLTDRLLSQGRVLVNSGTMYGPASGEGFIRLNIACPHGQMMEGLRRIRQTLCP